MTIIIIIIIIIHRYICGRNRGNMTIRSFAVSFLFLCDVFSPRNYSITLHLKYKCSLFGPHPIVKVYMYLGHI